MANKSLSTWFHDVFPSIFKGTERKHAQTFSAAAETLNAVDPDEFQSHLEDIMSRNPTVTTGRVQLINLEKIRDQLGDKWEQRSKIAHRIVGDVISRHLGSDDMFSRYGDLGYIIVFSNLDRQQAQLSTVLMAKEISMKMLGDDGHRGFIEVSTLVVKAGGQVSIDKLPSLSELVKELEKHQELEVVTSENMDESLPLMSKDIQFIFRPIWFVKQHVISTFLCIPVSSAPKGPHVSNYLVLDDPNDPAQIFDLDVLTVMTVGKELVRAHSQQKAALLAIPVHFETLANNKRRWAYFEKCRTALKQSDDKIIFEVVGLPDGIPDSRVVEILAPLKRLSRSILARFSIDHRNFMGYHAAGIHAVGIDLFETEEGEKKLIKDMARFVIAANNGSLKTYVHGVRSLSLNTAAVTSGFDYIDGYVLTSASKSTEGAYFLGIEDLYKP